MSEFRIPTTQWKIDGAAMGIKPGDRLIFKGTYADTVLINLVGSPDKPIEYIADGEVTFRGKNEGSRCVQFQYSKYIKFGSPEGRFIITGVSAQGLDFRELSSDIECQYVTFTDLGYGGFFAKTDPICNDPRTQRGNFVLQNINLHHCRFIRMKTGEPIYIGESHYHTTVASKCLDGTVKQVKEHEVKNVKITDNVIEDCGRDGMQVGSCTEGGYIARNVIKGYGKTNEYGQNAGIQVNPGTVAIVEENIIDTGTGYGLSIQGRMGTIARRNLVKNTVGGVFTVARENDPGSFLIENNTFLDIMPNAGNFMDYYSNTTLKNNVIQMKTGTPVFKKYGGTLTDTNNYKASGTLALDASGVPTAESKIPAGVGWKDYVPPKPVVTKEGATLELITTDGIQEWWMVSETGKRKKIT